MELKVTNLAQLGQVRAMLWDPFYDCPCERVYDFGLAFTEIVEDFFLYLASRSVMLEIVRSEDEALAIVSAPELCRRRARRRFARGLRHAEQVCLSRIQGEHGRGLALAKVLLAWKEAKVTRGKFVCRFPVN